MSKYKDKHKEPRKRITSAWSHILALLQDGYNSHAQAIVESEERTIDELHKRLAVVKAENDVLQAINAQQADIISLKSLDNSNHE
jgi:hypothetical protein